ncbi:MAG: response regulator [Candidatus Omnitrophota bacterium]|nr:response regulator [Candidatus Omnitrophota bacterium]
MEKIMVVDDEREFVFVLCERLKDAGFSVVNAYDGKSAIGIAKAEQPDVIILDIILPDMDGNIVARKLKGDPRTCNIPVIFLTGLLSKNETEKRGASIAGSIFVPKTAKMKELFAEINRILDKKRGREK